MQPASQPTTIRARLRRWRAPRASAPAAAPAARLPPCAAQGEGGWGGVFRVWHTRAPRGGGVGGVFRVWHTHPAHARTHTRLFTPAPTHPRTHNTPLQHPPFKHEHTTPPLQHALKSTHLKGLEMNSSMPAWRHRSPSAASVSAESATITGRSSGGRHSRTRREASSPSISARARGGGGGGEVGRGGGGGECGALSGLQPVHLCSGRGGAISMDRRSAGARRGSRLSPHAKAHARTHTLHPPTHPPTTLSPHPPTHHTHPPTTLSPHPPTHPPTTPTRHVDIHEDEIVAIALDRAQHLDAVAHHAHACGGGHTLW